MLPRLDLFVAFDSWYIAPLLWNILLKNMMVIY